MECIGLGVEGRIVLLDEAIVEREADAIEAERFNQGKIAGRDPTVAVNLEQVVGFFIAEPAAENSIEGCAVSEHVSWCDAERFAPHPGFEHQIVAEVATFEQDGLTAIVNELRSR